VRRLLILLAFYAPTVTLVLWLGMSLIAGYPIDPLTPLTSEDNQLSGGGFLRMAAVIMTPFVTLIDPLEIRSRLK
jgi:hypothetical protein